MNNNYIKKLFAKMLSQTIIFMTFLIFGEYNTLLNNALDLQI
jgi:hypothetical protein